VKRFLYLPLAVLLAGCSELPRATQASASKPEAVPVRTAEVVSVDWPSTYEATGTVRARTSGTVSSKLMSAVREVRVQTGEHVNEGQLLIVLDSRELDAGVHRAEAAREELRSAFSEADGAVSGAKANLDLAQATYNRMQDLYNKRSISTQEFDEASARLKSAQAAYDVAHAKRPQLDAKLSQIEQEIRAAQVSRGYAEIAAPFSGVVTAKQIEPGNMAIPGAPLLTIERDGADRLEASVEESRLTWFHAGQTLPVKLESGTVSGSVSEIPEVDPASRSGVVKIDLPPMAGLKSGSFGRALLGSAARKVLAVPIASVIEKGQLESVLVAEGGIARARLVTIGAKKGDRAEVLSGLRAGDKVIVAAPPGVSDGSPIEVLP